MKQLKPSTQSRKDHKKIANNPQKIAAFKRIANHLSKCCANYGYQYRNTLLVLFCIYLCVGGVRN